MAKKFQITIQDAKEAFHRTFYPLKSDVFSSIELCYQKVMQRPDLLESHLYQLPQPLRELSTFLTQKNSPYLKSLLRVLEERIFNMIEGDLFYMDCFKLNNQCKLILLCEDKKESSLLPFSMPPFYSLPREFQSPAPFLPDHWCSLFDDWLDSGLCFNPNLDWKLNRNPPPLKFPLRDPVTQRSWDEYSIRDLTENYDSPFSALETELYGEIFRIYLFIPLPETVSQTKTFLSDEEPEIYPLSWSSMLAVRSDKVRVRVRVITLGAEDPGMMNGRNIQSDGAGECLKFV